MGMEAAIDRASGDIRVERVVCARKWAKARAHDEARSLSGFNTRAPFPRVLPKVRNT